MRPGAFKRKESDRFGARREKTSRALLEAAQQVVAAKGYHAAKIVDIARTAGVGVGTFYLYYPTKKAIFQVLVEDAVRRLKQEVDTVRARVKDPADSARSTTETFFRFAQQNRDLFRIVFGHDASFHDVVRESQEMFVRDIRENLLAGFTDGSFRPGNTEIWARAIIGMSIQVVSWWIEQDGVPIEDVTGAVADLTLYGLSTAPSQS